MSEQNESSGLYYHTCSLTHPERIRMTFLKYELPKISNGRVLDWGCSEGDTTNDLKGIYANSEVIGIDIDTKLIEEASKRYKSCKFLVMDGFNLQFDKEHFDAIFCLNNLVYTIARSSNEILLRESFAKIKSCVKEKGYLVLSGEPEDEGIPNYLILRRDKERFLPEKIRFDRFGEAGLCLEKTLRMTR